jgi:hypothetical protein
MPSSVHARSCSGGVSEDVEPDRVGAVGLDELVGADDVPLRLRHLRPVELHPALVKQPGEGLAETDKPEVVEHLHEEA